MLFLLWPLLSVAAKSSFVRDKVLQPQWLDQPIFALFHSYTKNSCSLLVSKIFSRSITVRKNFSCSLNGFIAAISEQENPCSLKASLQSLVSKKILAHNDFIAAIRNNFPALIITRYTELHARAGCIPFYSPRATDPGCSGQTPDGPLYVACDKKCFSFENPLWFLFPKFWSKEYFNL